MLHEREKKKKIYTILQWLIGYVNMHNHCSKLQNFMQNASPDMGYWYILRFYGFYIKPMRMLGSRNKNWLSIPLVGINTIYVWIKFNIIPSYQDNKIYTNTKKIITQEQN